MELEKFKESLKGPIPTLLTPFKKDNIFEVDHDAIRQNLRYLIDAGIKTVMTTGSNGEFSSLTDEERKEIWKTVVSEGKGKVTIIAGNAQPGTKATIELAQYGEKLGVDGFLTTHPYYMQPDDEGLYQHYKQLAESTKLGIIIYNNPRCTKINMALPVLERLAQIPNIVSVKETAYDMNQFYYTIRIFEKLNKPIVCGMGDHWYSWCGLFDGCTSFVTNGANWYPDISLELHEAAQRRDLPAVDKIRRRLDPFRAMLLRIQKIRHESFLAVVKEPMDMIEGLSGGMVRLPLTPLTNDERTELREILKGMDRKLGA
ncbi:dihydrodipicolinate synthase family protein [Chloroflexota bacterium]